MSDATPLADDGLRPVRGVPGVWRAAPGWSEELLDADGLPLARWSAEGRLEAVKRNRHRTVWRLRLDPAPETGEPRAVFVKVASGGRGGNWRALADRSRPFREAEAAARVASLGIATAAPLLAGRFAWGVPPLRLDGFFAGRRWRRGPARALVTRSVEPAVPLPTVMAASDKLAPSVRRAVTATVAETIAKLHVHGLFPGDLHPGNLFLRGFEARADGGFDLEREALEPVLIDLAPLHRRRGWPGRRGRVARSLGMFSHGVFGASTISDRMRFLAVHYEALLDAADAQNAGFLGRWRDWVDFVEGVRRTETTQRHARRDRHWRRGCRGMRIVDRRTRCVADLSDAEAEQALSLAGPGAASVGGRPVRTLRLSPPAARRGWEIGHAMRRRGLPVAEPLVCRQEQFAGTLVVSAGTPLPESPEMAEEARRLCETLRTWGYMIDGPHAEDFQLDAAGTLELANPAAVRLAGGDEQAPTPDFDLTTTASPPLRRAA
ncbi:MAG: lipopolysaccharide kinase InaA family protein [Planctomycetota bacterium]